MKNLEKAIEKEEGREHKLSPAFLAFGFATGAGGLYASLDEEGLSKLIPLMQTSAVGLGAAFPTKYVLKAFDKISKQEQERTSVKTCLKNYGIGYAAGAIASLAYKTFSGL